MLITRTAETAITLRNHAIWIHIDGNGAAEVAVSRLDIYEGHRDQVDD